ncbi:MAG: glycosyltransferase [Nitrospinae bacterium]|nr:glycosyltransferase [Nitrospinota bacterium]
MAINVCVIVPCYNNPETISGVVGDAAGSGFPVIVVDDGSTNPLPDMRDATVVRHDVNRGKGAAILTGARLARERGATHIITMDADGQHLGVDIPALVAVAEKEPDALVVGVRDFDGENIPASSRYGREWSNLWITFHNGERCLDALSGFRLYPIDRLLECAPKSDGFESEAETLILWGRFEWPIRWVGVKVVYAPPGERVSHFRKGRDNWRLTKLHTRFFFGSLWRKVTGRRNTKTSWVKKPRGLPLAYRFMEFSIKMAGRRSAYVVAWFVVPYFYLFAPEATRNIIRFLKRAAGSSSVTAISVYQAFAVSLIDRVARVSGSQTGLYQVAPDRELMRKTVVDNGRVIFLSAHFGHWDVGMRFAIDSGFNVAALMNRDQADFAQAYFERADIGKPRVLAVDEGRGVVDIVNALNEGLSVAMHGDRIMRGQRPVSVNFLGEQVDIPSGPYQVAYVTGTAILPVFCVKTGVDEVTIEMAEPIIPLKTSRNGRDAEIARMANLYTEALEKVVKTHPEQWFNFHDFFGDDR